MRGSEWSLILNISPNNWQMTTTGGSFFNVPMSQKKDPDSHDPPGVKIDGNKGVVASNIILSGGKNQIIGTPRFGFNHWKDFDAKAGQLRKTIHIAVNLADHMVSYAARIKGADVRMRDIADRIRATSSILHGIEILFEQLTSKPPEESSKVPDAANDLYAELQSCETWLGGVEKQMSEFMEGVPAPRRLEGKEREKVELAQESLVLLETKITIVEFGIQDHKVNLQIRLSIFFMTFSNQKLVVNWMMACTKRELTCSHRPDLTWSDMISDMLSELRHILSELDLLRNGTVPKSLRSPALDPSNSSQLGRVPAPAAFSPRYAGWVIQRGSSHATGSDARGRSWLRPSVEPLAFSSEQLYLQVVALMVKDGKKDQTLHDRYERLGPQRQSAILDLLARENQELQIGQPVLEWKVAGIRPEIHRINRYRTEIVSMLIILKTELKPQVHWGSLKGHQVPSLRGGADRAEWDPEDGRYTERHTSGARHVRPPRHHRRDHEQHRDIPEEIPRIYNTHAGPSHDARQHHQRNNGTDFERLQQQQHFTRANPVFAFSSRPGGVLWTARLDARARTYHGKEKARAHERRRNDDELIHALVEDWYEVISVWPRSHLTASYNIAQTAVPGSTHVASAYGISTGHQYATTGTYASPTFAMPVHGDAQIPAHEAGDTYTVTAQGLAAAHPTDNSGLASTSTRRRRTGRTRRQGRVITLQAIIGTSRQQRSEEPAMMVIVYFSRVLDSQ
ncbi:uncharacterized protein CC84DRAFT_1174646 [Paraphaeosphaeria sporulosa]|uniref:Uncharacterized protein n=1 Tax=Paraphaeosphaeria sporulosa TaxID=1460663 RepID=A0A177CHL3_9PLEO|nr:uncharacterized protein CC84DRAFT_1174646 [Paraphaeosphaeria sporulosa]OAG06711.1 hypothetical protein CC84DRAFT_1174646 [Paraphaeosphaeria sporulosa]